MQGRDEPRTGPTGVEAKRLEVRNAGPTELVRGRAEVAGIATGPLGEQAAEESASRQEAPTVGVVEPFRATELLRERSDLGRIDDSVEIEEVDVDRGRSGKSMRKRSCSAVRGGMRFRSP